MTNNKGTLLLIMGFILTMGFSIWNALLNNFVIEKAAFDGAQIGVLQSLREIPGFLAFTAVYILLFIREQRFALLSLAAMSVGVAVTGMFPQALGLYLTTVLMSTGFHYYETMNQSLTLQWINKKETPHFMGRILSVKAAAALIAYAAIWISMEYLSINYIWVYLSAGLIGLLITIYIAVAFPLFPEPVVQHKKLILRKRYWLFYVLTFLGGARRQMFLVFAGFMMVEKFHYSVGDIALLFAINYLFNLFFAPSIGKWIGRIGEHKTLTLEYIGLIFVFCGYALTENALVAACLYIIDHLFFALAIAIKTYFQKIADPKDIAATAGVSFSINHIAAVFIPALLGILWLRSPSAVFYIGAMIALLSLLLAQCIPHIPSPGNECCLSGKR